MHSHGIIVMLQRLLADAIQMPGIHLRGPACADHTDGLSFSDWSTHDHALPVLFLEGHSLYYVTAHTVSLLCTGINRQCLSMWGYLAATAAMVSVAALLVRSDMSQQGGQKEPRGTPHGLVLVRAAAATAL